MRSLTERQEPGSTERGTLVGGQNRAQLVGWVFFGLALLASGGCASSGGGSGGSGSQRAQETTQVTVQNENAIPITVYLWWEGGRRVRLGDVNGVSQATFTTPSRGVAVWFEFEDRLGPSIAGRSRRPNNYFPVGRRDHVEVVTGRGGYVLSVRRIPRI